MPGSRSGTFNQALMELGAMICVPNGAPKCGGVSGGRILPSKSAWNGTESSGEKEKTGTAKRRKTVLVLRDGERVAIRSARRRGCWQECMNCRIWKDI